MKFSALNFHNIMCMLTANQNARVIMKIYYDHCDSLNAAHETTTQSVRSEFLSWVKMVPLNRLIIYTAFRVLTIGKNGIIGRPIPFDVLPMVPILPT